MKTTGNVIHQNCFNKQYKYRFMYDLFLLLFWFSYIKCLTGKGLRVESRCVCVCARHAK